MISQYYLSIPFSINMLTKLFVVKLKRIKDVHCRCHLVWHVGSNLLQIVRQGTLHYLQPGHYPHQYMFQKFPMSLIVLLHHHHLPNQ